MQPTLTPDTDTWSHRRFRSMGGFTIIELMIVICVIGILASIAMPSYITYRNRAKYGRFIHDVRTAGSAFTAHLSSSTDYPPETAPGVCPAGMESLLPGFFAQAPSIGGQWDWDNGQNGIAAGISVVSPDPSVDQMQIIDRFLDDGNLSTGKFRSRPGGYIYVLQE